LEEDVEVIWFSSFFGFLDSIIAAIISEDPIIDRFMILPFSSFLKPSSVMSYSSVVFVSFGPCYAFLFTEILNLSISSVEIISEAAFFILLRDTSDVSDAYSFA